MKPFWLQDLGVLRELVWPGSQVVGGEHGQPLTQVNPCRQTGMGEGTACLLNTCMHAGRLVNWPREIPQLVTSPRQCWLIQGFELYNARPLSMLTCAVRTTVNFDILQPLLDPGTNRNHDVCLLSFRFQIHYLTGLDDSHRLNALRPGYQAPFPRRAPKKHCFTHYMPLNSCASQWSTVLLNQCYTGRCPNRSMSRSSSA